MSLLQNSNAISAPADTGFYPYQIANSIRGSAAGDTTLKWTAGTPTTFNIYCARHSSGSTLYMGWGDMGSFGHSADWITIQEIKA